MSLQPINQFVPGSPKNLRQNKGLQEVKCLKAVKPTARVSKPQDAYNKQPGFIPRLSGSEPRSVAGHVSREGNRISMAEAAPSNSSLSSSKTSQQSRRRRRRTGHRNASNNKDDDSDSDSEDRYGGLDKDPDWPRRRAVASNEDETMDDDTSAALAREENDRVRLLQALTKIGLAWESRRGLREHNRRSGRRRMQSMIDRYGFGIDVGATPESTSRISDELAVLDDQSRRRQEYLDDALYGNIEGKHQTIDGKDSIPDRLEELVQRAELGVIQRCRTVDPYARSWDLLPPKPPARLISIVKNMYSAAWNHLSALPHSPDRNSQDFLVISCGFIEDKCRKGDHSTGESLVVDPLIDFYFKAMVEDLSMDLLLDVNAGRRRRELDTLRVCEKLQTSRHDDHLTSVYSAWASSRLDSEQKETIFVGWDRIKKQDTLSQFRRLMHSTKTTIRQEFCTNIVTPGVVSLVLFKGDWPSTVKDVTPDELQNMGWILEETKDGHQFVRLETRADTEAGQQYILKVSMDEEILAIRRLESRQWIDWDREYLPLKRHQRHTLSFFEA